MPHRVLFVGIGGDTYTTGVIKSLKDSGHISFAAGVVDETQRSVEFDQIITTFAECLFADYGNPVADNSGVSDDLFDAIRSEEGNILRQMDRLLYEPTASHREVPFEGTFDERRRLLFRHLLFWDLQLRKHRISAVAFHNVPHQVFDTILFYLCRARSISTLIFSSVGVFKDSYFVSETIEDLGLLNLGERLCESRRHLIVDSNERIISDWQRVCSIVDAEGRAHVATHPYSLTRSLVNDGYVGGQRLTAQTLLRGIVRRARRIALRSTDSRVGFLAKQKRLREVAAARRRELASLSKGDLPDRYLYFPLHFQPEASTSARGRHYVELREVVASITSALPEGVQLVIKEHPHQYEKLLPRPKNFFTSLVALPKTHLVDSSLDSASLRRGSLGVVTVSGSNGFEVLATGKGVIAFGSASWREAPGVWTIRSQRDVVDAIQAICNGQPTERTQYSDFLQRLRRSTILADLSDSRRGRPSDEDALMLRATQTNIRSVLEAWFEGLPRN